MSEKQLQATVVALARLYGWKIHHCRPAQNARGEWRTPIQGDRGFPDLVLASIHGLLFVELKSEKGRVSAGQREWLDRLGLHRHDRLGVVVWRPKDLTDGTVEQFLKRHGK